MKKIIISYIAVLLFLCSTGLIAEQPKVLDGKIGTGYATDPDKFGWQLDFAYMTELDPFFALGFESGVFWAAWERTVGKKDVGTSSINADVKADTNAFCIPLLVNAQVRLPNLEKKLYVLPYVSVGIGYSFMIFQYSQPEYESTSGTVAAKSDVELYHGFTWQVLLGAAFDPGMNSKIKFLGEAGYRREKLKKGDLEIDMSGFVFNIGIRYPF